MKISEKAKELKTKLDELAKAIITDPEKLKAFSDQWRLGFHTYSFRNLLLIFMQLPKATICAGYKQWIAKYERKVRAGERALWILAPMIVTEKRKAPSKDEDGTEIPISDPRLVDFEKKICIGFRSVPVFDISQTEGKPLDMGMNKTKFEGSEITLDSMISKFPEYQIKLVESTSDGSAFWDSNIIHIAKRSNKAQEIASFFHELAHHMLGHTDSKKRKESKKSKDVIELEAEATAFLVCSCIGIDRKENSAEYLGNWGGSKDKLESSAYLILSTTEKILKKIKGESK